MAHPYARHNEKAVGKRRANKLLHGNEYASGGSVEDVRRKGLNTLRHIEAAGPELSALHQRLGEERAYSISDRVPRRKE